MVEKSIRRKHLIEITSLVVIITVVIIAGIELSGENSNGQLNTINSDRIIQNNGSGYIVAHNKINDQESLNIIPHNPYPDGENGNRFTDTNAGFTVLTPNEKWHFIKDAAEFRKVTKGFDTTSPIIGSVIVSRNDGSVNIMIGVQEGPEITSVDMNNWLARIISEYNTMGGMKIQAINKKVSTDGNYGYLETIARNSNQVRYDYEVDQFVKDRLYTLHVNSNLPQNISHVTKDEINFVVNSFEILS